MGIEVPAIDGLAGQKREYWYKRIVAAVPELAGANMTYDNVELTYYRLVNEGIIKEPWQFNDFTQEAVTQAISPGGLAETVFSDKVADAVDPLRVQLVDKADATAVPTLDEMVTTTSIDTSVISNYLLAAPFPLRIAYVSLMTDVSVAASDTNYLNVELFRTRAGGQASMGALKTTKLTGGEPIQVSTPWTFDSVPFTESRRLLETLDGLKIQISKVGTVALSARVLVTVRYQPL